MLSSSSAEKYVQIEAWEIHGLAGYSWHYDVKFPDIQESSRDRTMNFYSLFPEHKDYEIKQEFPNRKDFIVDTGIHLRIPKGYALYVFTDPFIEQEYNLKIEKKFEIYHGECFPFEIPLKMIHRKRVFTIKNKQLIARGCILPLPEVDYLVSNRNKEQAIRMKCEKIKIKKVGEIKNGSGCSGGSGWSKPINTNSIS